MAIKTDFERLRVNREVCYVLSRHQAEFAKLHTSCTSNMVVYIAGHLIKASRQDFDINSIEAIIHEIRAIANVREIQFDLDNWDISVSASYIKRKYRAE